MASAVVISSKPLPTGELDVCLTNGVPLPRNGTFVMKRASEKLGEVPWKTCQIPPPLYSSDSISYGKWSSQEMAFCHSYGAQTHYRCAGLLENIAGVKLLENVPPLVCLRRDNDWP